MRRQKYGYGQLSRYGLDKGRYGRLATDFGYYFWVLRSVFGLYPVPLDADGKPLAMWENGNHWDAERMLKTFRLPEAVGIGVLLTRSVAAEVEDWQGFLRWLQRRGLELPMTTMIQHPKGRTLLYWYRGFDGVRKHSWGRILGTGALVVVPDTKGYRYLTGLEDITTAPDAMLAG